MKRRESKDSAATAAATPSFLRAQSDGVYLTLKVQPRSSRSEVGEPLGDALKIRVTAPPVDSAANIAVLELLAEILECPRGAITLIRGQTSRTKCVRVQNLSVAVIATKLAAAARSGTGGRSRG